MESKKPKPVDVDAYISGFPASTQKLLTLVRATIRKAVPEAIESVSYGIVGYKCNGPLIYFGAYARHIGLYPGGGAIKAFEQQLKDYKTAKGTVQFPLDKPMPFDLIKEIVVFRVKENGKKAAKK